MQNSWIVNDYIILAVVNENLNLSKSIDNIACIASRDIISEGSVDSLVSRDIIDCSAKFCFISIEKCCKRLVKTIVVPEIENADVAHIHFGSCIVICDEVKVVGRILIFTIIYVDDGMSLEPCADISELFLYDSYRPEIRIVIVDLIYRVSPAITNAQAL